MHALIISAAYVWTQIVVPGATVTQAFGLNDKDQTAVSLSDGRSGIYRHREFTPLPPPPAGMTVGATGINDSGVITGVATTAADAHEQGFVLVGTTYTFFSRPGWANTEARAIGNQGLVTGYNFDDGFTTSAGFIYDPSTGVFTDATPPGSTFTITQGINRQGRITGNGRQASLGRYAFVWQQAAAGKSVPFLARTRVDGGGSSGRGINDDGTITGFTVGPAGTNEGFVGSDATGYQTLIPPGGAAPNGTVCEGINNRAQVVCSTSDPDGNTITAFIGSPEGEREGD